MDVRALAVAALLAGCATPEPQRIEVKVPVPVRAEPPPELSVPWQPPAAPVFLLPSDETATSCLAPRGEDRLRILLLEAVTRVRAWEAWVEDGE